MQLGLFGKSEIPAIDASFAGLTRTELEPGAWFDHAQGWLRGHQCLFDVLVSSMRWRSERREMYTRVVDVPRLYALVPEDGAGRRTLSARYGEQFERVSLAHYRDGRDSVAWHGDTVARELQNAVVATVSVGAPRRFLLRPKAGGHSLALSLGWGDLLVMGGSCQRTWQHSVPKVVNAGPRIAIMFRPSWSNA
jgi:alkylated DNA repair dioxygenase AlkB